MFIVFTGRVLIKHPRGSELISLGTIVSLFITCSPERQRYSVSLRTMATLQKNIFLVSLSCLLV